MTELTFGTRDAMNRRLVAIGDDPLSDDQDHVDQLIAKLVWAIVRQRDSGFTFALSKVLTYLPRDWVVSVMEKELAKWEGITGHPGWIQERLERSTFDWRMTLEILASLSVDQDGYVEDMLALEEFERGAPYDFDNFPGGG